MLDFVRILWRIQACPIHFLTEYALQQPAEVWASRHDKKGKAD